MRRCYFYRGPQLSLQPFHCTTKSRANAMAWIYYLQITCSVCLVKWPRFRQLKGWADIIGIVRILNVVCLRMHGVTFCKFWNFWNPIGSPTLTGLLFPESFEASEPPAVDECKEFVRVLWDRPSVVICNSKNSSIWRVRITR